MFTNFDLKIFVNFEAKLSSKVSKMFSQYFNATFDLTLYAGEK